MLFSHQVQLKNKLINIERTKLLENKEHLKFLGGVDVTLDNTFCYEDTIEDVTKYSFSEGKFGREIINFELKHDQLSREIKK